MRKDFRRGSVDVETCVTAALDPKGRGLTCLTPVLPNAQNLFLEVSLDGRSYLTKAQPFSFYDLIVDALQPNCGPLTERTEVMLQTRGLIQSSRQVVRLNYEADDIPSLNVPGRYDHTTQSISFTMPDLKNQVAEPRKVPAPEDQENNDPDAEKNEEKDEIHKSDVKVAVALSINGQDYTESCTFTFYSSLEAVLQNDDEEDIDALDVEQPFRVKMDTHGSQQAFVRFNFTESVVSPVTVACSIVDGIVRGVAPRLSKEQFTAAPTQATIDISLNGQHYTPFKEPSVKLQLE